MSMQSMCKAKQSHLEKGQFKTLRGMVFPKMAVAVLYPIDLPPSDVTGHPSVTGGAYR